MKSLKLILAAAAASCAALLATPVLHAQTASARPNEPIQPLPAASADLEPAKVQIGGQLFADKRLSADGTVSCQSCHLPNAGGADPRRHSVSAFGKVRELNSPSIFNMEILTNGLNWTGRTANLDKQIAGSISNSDTMAHSWPKVLDILAADAKLAEQMKAAYGGEQPVNQANVSHAIVSFERSLVTPSRFDDWLKGDDKAITPREKKGYELFKANGCVACHNGVAVGGNSFQRFAPIGDYWKYREAKGRGAMVEVDKGRFLVTKKDEDMHMFRVAPLRNVALTAPYFHDGSVPTLDEAILLMGRHQLGREIPAKDRKDIEMFLRSLTGKDLERLGQVAKH